MQCIYDWFAGNGHAAFVNVIFVFCSFLVAVVAIIISSRTQTRLKHIEEQRERHRLYDRKKARLRASGIKEIHSKRGCSVYLLIENFSDFASARDIKIKIDGVVYDKHPDTLKAQSLNLLGPNSSVRFLFTEKYADAIFSDIVITWEDDSEESGQYETTVSFL